jgi:eukaryotic-like serine/threonine-protein kinase
MVEVPSQIGPYKIESLLRKGGTSNLYLGIHPETGELIAIKVLFQEHVGNPEMVQRFLTEAQIIALANHPNIVQLFGQGEWEGNLYIAMEFIQGVTLKQYLLENLISLKQGLEFILEISLALCHLHVHGIIHRDLKPENILVTESGNIKVIDFGISQVMSDQLEDIHTPHHKQLLGTPIYMSPEQKDNPESVSYPSDIYSLAIIAYELALGKLCHGHVHLPLMPKKLQKILAKALQPKPKDRYQDIVDFMSDISGYLHSPTLSKETQELTPLSELSESLKQAQYFLTPQKGPQWPQIQTGFAFYKNFGVSSCYYDFFELPNNTYGVIIGEPSIRGVSGIIYTSILRGMVRSLCKFTQDPAELASVLNTLLIEDPIKQIFSFSYLILQPNENKIRYISCGSGQLWHYDPNKTKTTFLKSENPSLGLSRDSQFSGIDHFWNQGDSIFLSTTSDSTFISNELLLHPIEASPQRHIDSVVRKSKVKLTDTSKEHILFLLHLKRE